MLKDKKCTIRVGDANCLENARRVAKSNGILDVCNKHNVPFTVLDKTTRVSVHDRKWTIAEDLQWTDHVINLPKLKAHQQLYFTGALKNCFGFVTGKRKFIRHMFLGDGKLKFAAMLLDMASAVNPSINILDGIVGHEGRGPINGDPVELNLLGASTNPLALDCAVVELLKGNREMIPYMVAARDMENWRDALSPDVLWKGESFEPQTFHFPDVLIPIRFSVVHAIASVGRRIVRTATGRL
ncbi:MAG: DUF362 domain-containing protein, partial [SAR324 cluster bacterium]|nr:DUF362 domain-containing protein [SAR324 cluster bacterium]